MERFHRHRNANLLPWSPPQFTLGMIQQKMEIQPYHVIWFRLIYVWLLVYLIVYLCLVLVDAPELRAYRLQFFFYIGWSVVGAILVRVMQYLYWKDPTPEHFVLVTTVTGLVLGEPLWVPISHIMFQITCK
jgi:branched-subunit amino acid transport protein